MRDRAPVRTDAWTLRPPRCDMGEDKDEAGSTLNEGEAVVVRAHLERLLDAGVRGNGSNSSPPPPSRPLQTHLLRRVRGRQAPAPERKTSLISGGLSQ